MLAQHDTKMAVAWAILCQICALKLTKARENVPLLKQFVSFFGFDWLGSQLLGNLCDARTGINIVLIPQSGLNGP
jgi:hypothetical protein